MRLFLRRIIIIFMVCSVYVLISTSFVVINTTAISFPQTSMGKAILSDQLGLSALSIKDGLPIKVALSTSIVPTVNIFRIVKTRCRQYYCKARSTKRCFLD